MDIELKKLTGLNRKLIVSFSQEEILKVYQKHLAAKQKKTKLDGFRPGKAPLNLIEKRFKAELIATTKEELVQNSLSEVESKHHPRYAYRPEFQVGHLDLEAPFSYHAFFEETPEIKLLDLAEFNIPKIELKIDESKVDLKLKETELELAEYQETADPAAKYDRIHGIMQGKDERGVFYNEQGEEKYFSLGLEHIFPEVEKDIIGLKKGDEKTISYKYPDDFSEATLAGKTVQYHIKVTKIMRPKPFQWEKQQFAKIDPKIEDEAGLRTYIKDYLLTVAKNDLLQQQCRSLKEQLLQKLDFAVPEKIINTRITRLQKSDARYNAIYQGLEKANLDGKSEFTFKTDPQAAEEVITVAKANEKLTSLQAEFKQQSVSQSRLDYYIAQISEKQGLKPRKELVDRSFSEVARSIKVDGQAFVKSPFGQNLYQNMLAEDVENQALSWHLTKKP